MKVIRLKPPELREWKANVRHLVDDEGYVRSKIPKTLDDAIVTVFRSAQSRGRSVEQKVGVAGKEYVIRVTARQTGINSMDIAFETTVDGMRVMSGHDVLCAKMFAEHGECQLRRPNGIILRVVRDPTARRPTFEESTQIAPRPEHCPCRNWGNPHPGHHYPTCPYNRLAPLEERAPSDVVPEAEAALLPTMALSTLAKPALGGAPLATTPLSVPLSPSPLVPMPLFAPTVATLAPSSAVVQPPPLDPPDSCRNGCLGWATPPKFPVPQGQHHPMCTFAKDWSIKTNREVPRWLVDLRTGLKVRRADDEEVSHGEIQARKTGAPIIHVDDVPYAVILETELDRELAEAIEPPVIERSA